MTRRDERVDTIRETPQPATERDDALSMSEREDVLRRIERVKTIREIFDAGYRAGHANAGLRSNPDTSYEEWLMDEGGYR